MQKGRMKESLKEVTSWYTDRSQSRHFESTLITSLIGGGTSGHYALHEARGTAVDPHLPDKPITKKPAEVRMGKGKGNPEGFVAPVTPGRIPLRGRGCSLAVAQEALRLGAQKPPITTSLS